MPSYFIYIYLGVMAIVGLLIAFPYRWYVKKQCVRKIAQEEAKDIVEYLAENPAAYVEEYLQSLDEESRKCPFFRMLYENVQKELREKNHEQRRSGTEGQRPMGRNSLRSPTWWDW